MYKTSLRTTNGNGLKASPVSLDVFYEGLGISKLQFLYTLFVRYCMKIRNQCCGSGSAWIRIDFCQVYPDQDPGRNFIFCAGCSLLWASLVALTSFMEV
jgi:hypothetical protein